MSLRSKCRLDAAASFFPSRAHTSARVLEATTSAIKTAWIPEGMGRSWPHYTICTKMYNILLLYENVQIIESARYRANGKKGSGARPRGFPADAAVNWDSADARR